MQYVTHRRLSILAASLVAALSLAACTTTGPNNPDDITPSAYQKPLLGKVLRSDIHYLEQGWDDEMREQFYYTPQGSRLMPYRWFMALENADDKQAFATAENLAQFGWLEPVRVNERLNPGQLPVGFAIDPVELDGTGKWVGMTCAACHTNDVTYQGKRLRIDGGAALADFGAFMTALAGAVNATLLDKAKFERFALKVLGEQASEAQLNALSQRYASFATMMMGRVTMRTPPLPAGAGRVDALGQIVNALAVFDLKEPDNLRPPSAPVSYPFLWYTPDLAWVQWNPIASNPIARNAGEVLGVFGHAQFTGSAMEQQQLTHNREAQQQLQQLAKDLLPPKAREKVLLDLDKHIAHLNADKFERHGGQQPGLLASSALFKNLNDLEVWLRDLKSPRWDDASLGPVDDMLGWQGKALFARYCRSCHNMPPFDMTPKEQNIIGKQFIEVGRINYQQVGTDPLYVENLTTRLAKTGDLSDLLFDGREVVSGVEFFLGTVGAVVQKGMTDMGLTLEQKMAYSDYRFYPAKAGEAPKPYSPDGVDNLKAGPLLGIWATAPYLHNGSVPNIYELLSVPEQRTEVFWVGNRELDTERLGFVATRQPGLFRFDTRLPGNSNQGHIYPRKGLKHDEKMALIAYLKDPMRFVEKN